MSTLIKSKEEKRLAALQSYKILDTLAESAYDDLTSIASLICDAPIALVSLIDFDRQWFKSKVGLEANETPRNISFCTHAIEGTDLFVVEDAIADPRFRDNPLVTSAPSIRFYAGAPLIDAQGHGLGTLCVIDRIPRKLTERQCVVLQALSRQVVSLLELRKASAELAKVLEDVTKLTDLLPICVWCKKVRDDDGFWTRVEDYFKRQTGIETSHGICPECSAKEKDLHIKS